MENGDGRPGGSSWRSLPSIGRCSRRFRITSGIPPVDKEILSGILSEETIAKGTNP